MNVTNNVTAETNCKSFSYPADPSSSIVLDKVQYKKK